MISRLYHRFQCRRGSGIWRRLRVWWVQRQDRRAPMVDFSDLGRIVPSDTREPGEARVFIYVWAPSDDGIARRLLLFCTEPYMRRYDTSPLPDVPHETTGEWEP